MLQILLEDAARGRIEAKSRRFQDSDRCEVALLDARGKNPRVELFESELHGQGKGRGPVPQAVLSLPEPVAQVPYAGMPVEAQGQFADRRAGSGVLDGEDQYGLRRETAAPRLISIAHLGEVSGPLPAQPLGHGGALVHLPEENASVRGPNRPNPRIPGLGHKVIEGRKAFTGGVHPVNVSVGPTRGATPLSSADPNSPERDEPPAEAFGPEFGPGFGTGAPAAGSAGPASKASIPARVWTSAGWLVGGRVFGSSCTVVMLWLLAQRLTERNFGIFTFWLAVFLVLDGIVDFGAGQVAVQRSARRPSDLPSVLKTARRARLVAATLVVGGVLAAASVMEEDGALFLGLAALYQLSHVLELSTIGWRNAIKWRSPVLVRAGASFASLVFVLALRATGEVRPLAYLAAVALGSTTGNVLLHAFGRRGLPNLVGVQAAPMGPFLAASIPIGAAAVCQQLYFHIDNVFVRALFGEEAVGHYSVAVRVMSLSIMGGVFASSAALPWLARAHGRGELLPATFRLTAVTGTMGLLISGALWPLRETLLKIFKPAFVDAAPALGWLLAAAAAVHIGAPLLTSVVARGDGRRVLGIAAGGLGINLIGNGLLAPAYGMEGAAIATFGTEIWVAAASLIALLDGANRSVPERRGEPVRP